MSSLLLKYLSKIKILNLFLFSMENKENNEYFLPETVNRKIVKKGRIKNLVKQTKKAKIDILIYNYYIKKEIFILNTLKQIKVIFYNHSCFLFWLYSNSPIVKTLYESYINCKYVISLVPFENDYLFQIWGIKSILMQNFISYEYENILPSDLSSKTILMIGRANDKLKRFELGIKAMFDIIKKIPICQLKIISNLDGVKDLKNLIYELKLENNVEFVGFTSIPEIYFRNSSLHIFSSISESFGLVLCETKIYGIPNILIGLDYIYISKGGTVIIYDDKPKSIAEEAIKILENKEYRKKLGKEARKSMKNYKNELILKRWIKLILSIYNGDNFYIKLKNEEKQISKETAKNLLYNQINLLKMRKEEYKNITIKDIENFSFIKKL